MSEKIGAMTFSRGEEHPFLGRKLAEEKSFSEEMAWLIDQEIAAIIREAEGMATQLVAANRAKLDAVAGALLEEETLDGRRVDEILSGIS
jgi:cell division protease FtsH